MDKKDILNPIYFTEVRKELNKSALVIAALCVVAGFAMYYVVPAGNPGSNFNIMRLSVGIAFFVIALCLACFRRSHFVYAPTGSAISRSSVNFDAANFDNLRKLLAPYSSELRIVDNSTVHLDYYYSRDRKFAAYQVFQYATFTDRVITDMIILTDDEAEGFINAVKRNIG